MTLPPAAQNDLTTCLGELEKLGLGRPENILITEYLAALTAENVFDAETASRVAAVYHRVHYGVADRDDGDLREAVVRLKAATAAIAALSESERHGLVQRFRGRLQGAAEAEASIPPADAHIFLTPARLPGGAMTPGNQRATDRPIEPDAAFQIEPNAPKNRRGVPRMRSLPLEAAVLIMMGLVITGYVLRHGIDRSLGRSENEMAAPGPAHVMAKDVWRHEDYWAANLRHRAQAEASVGSEQAAFLAFELLLSDMPRDAGALNDFAWLLLTSHDPAIHDSKRGLELALRALALNRAPSILDTAAEARFQAGDPEEAVKLEREAVDVFPKFGGLDDKQFWERIRQHLAIYQDAVRTAHSAVLPPASS